MTIRLIITYLLNLFDLAMTTYWVNKFGIEVEMNPFGRWLFSTNLVIPYKVFVIGAALFALYACIKAKPQYAWISWVVLAIYSILAIYHVILFSVINSIT